MTFPGPVLSARAFKQSGPSRLRSLSTDGYTTAVNESQPSDWLMEERSTQNGSEKNVYLASGAATGIEISISCEWST